MKNINKYSLFAKVTAVKNYSELKKIFFDGMGGRDPLQKAFITLCVGNWDLVYSTTLCR